MRSRTGIIAALLLGLNSLQSTHDLSAQNSGAQPEMIGEGIVSTPDDELAGNIMRMGQLYILKNPHHLTTCTSFSNPILLTASGSGLQYFRFLGSTKTRILSLHRTTRLCFSRRIGPWMAWTAIISIFGRQRERRRDGAIRN